MENDNSPDRHWFALGRFQVLALPLHLNPYWTTHHIYLKGKLVGKQLSVPNEADCEWYVTIRTVQVRDMNFHGRPRKTKSPGRPRAAYTRWLEGVAQ